MSKMLALIEKTKAQPNIQPPKAEQPISREEQYSTQLVLSVIACELDDKLGKEGIEWHSSRPSPKAGMGMYGVIRQ